MSPDTTHIYLNLDGRIYHAYVIAKLRKFKLMAFYFLN